MKTEFTMKKLIYCLFFTLSITLSCTQGTQQKMPSNSTNTNTNTNTKPNSQANSKQAGEKSKMHPKYPHIPIAEKGITVTNPDGWDKQTMDFHIGYCAQMLSSLSETYNPTVFCPCFLDKIQYYYEAIYFKEAYEDQEAWNQECLEEAKL